MVVLAGAASCVEVTPRPSLSVGLAGPVAVCLLNKYAPTLATAGNPAAGAPPGGSPAGFVVATAGNPAAGASPGGPPAGIAGHGDCMATKDAPGVLQQSPTGQSVNSAPVVVGPEASVNQTVVLRRTGEDMSWGLIWQQAPFLRGVRIVEKLEEGLCGGLLEPSAGAV